MDTDFINAYIAKQKAMIVDLQTRLLLSETRLQLVETRHQQTFDELTKCKQELEVLNTPAPIEDETVPVDTDSDLDS